MSGAKLIAALPPDFTLTLVDVGSAGGLNKRWKPFAPVLSSVLFDPREAEPSGSFGRGQTRVYPVALGERAGEAELHLTRMANMSSFLRPDPDVFGRFGKKRDDASAVSSEIVPIETLDQLAARDGFRPNVLKVDTQGSELMVLRGAEQSLGSVMLAEIEVSFFQRYQDQPTIADVLAHMADRGFELIELRKLKRYRSANRLGIRNAGVPMGERSGRIAYGDAIFLRREDAILAASSADDGMSLLHAIVALIAYGKADMAARLLDVAGAGLDAGRQDAIGRALKSLGGPLAIFGRLLRRS